MGGCISCLTSPTCSMFCGGLSTFAVIMLLMLGIAIKSEYRRVMLIPGRNGMPRRIHVVSLAPNRSSGALS